MSFRRRISGLRPDEIRNIPKSELTLPCMMCDFTEAIKKVNKSVSNDDIKKYKEWMDEFGSTWIDGMLCFFVCVSYYMFWYIFGEKIIEMNFYENIETDIMLSIVFLWI